MVKNVDVDRRLSRIEEQVDKVRVEDMKSIASNLADISRHLKTLNDNVEKHEKRIQENCDEIEKNRMGLAKITAVGAFGGGVVGIIFMFVNLFL